MTSAKRDSKYFVVGGPVQPGRDCCVLRDADAALYARLHDSEYCQVLAPPHTGKTTLMAQTANRLRGDNLRVATIDLSQISNRDMEDDVGRWYYSFAHRILRELRVRADLQSWWQERSSLTIMQRLREFFLDVVVAESDEPVVIFIDRIESAFGHSYGRQLLAAIRACHDARATEPGYRRLTFALLGSVPVGRRLRSDSSSPFDICQQIRLDDFSPTELHRLSAGLGLDQPTAKRISAAIWGWTQGHPYMSQKVFRGLARLPTTDPDESTVDAVVTQLFLAKDGPRVEPHLSAVARELLFESTGRNGRIGLYQKIVRGRRVVTDTNLDSHRELLLTGLVSPGPDGAFRVRNPVYAQAFSSAWLRKNNPLGWKGAAAVAAIALLVVAAPIWYTQFLPRPYVRALTASDQDYVSAMESYQRLSFLPGFQDQADELFSDYLVRQGREARSLAEVERLSQSLAQIPDQQALSQEMIAEYWERRTFDAMTLGDRDTAVMYALRMLERSTPERVDLLSELLGNDLERLRGTIRTPRPLRSVDIDPASGLVTALDVQNGIHVFQVGDDGPRRVQQFSLLAEEIIPLQRRLVASGGASGRRLKVTLRTDHLRPGDIMVDLQAPSGREVSLMLSPDYATGETGEYQFDSSRIAALRTLLEESIDGTWTAQFTDHQQGVSGNLLGWQLQIDNRIAALPVGVTETGGAIPEPSVARQSQSTIASGGRWAMTWTADAIVHGDILVWDTAAGEVVGRIPRARDFIDARFALGQRAILVRAGSVVELWDVASGEMRSRMAVETSFVPVLSANGQYLVIDTVSSRGENALSMWDLETMSKIGELTTGGVARLVAADSSGRFLAISDGDRLVRLWSIRDGQLMGEFKHGARPVEISIDPDNRWLMVEDAAHDFHVWSISQDSRPLLVRRGADKWQSSISGNTLLLGSINRGFEFIDLKSAREIGDAIQHGVAASRTSRERYVSQAVVADSLGFAATYDGRYALKFWNLPPRLGENEYVVAGSETVGAPRTTGAVAAIDRTGTRIALATAQGDVRILGVDQQALVVPAPAHSPGFIGHLDPIVRVKFSPDGRLVASGSLDGGIRVWESDSGAPRSFFAGHADDAVHDVAFSADNRYLFSAGRRSVIVLDAVTGELLARLRIQAESPQLSITDDAQRVYIAGDRGGLTRWLWQGNIVDAVIAPDSGVKRIALSADEKVLATIDESRRVQLYDAGSMVPKERRVRLPGAADYFEMSGDGRQIFIQAGAWLYLLSAAQDGLMFAASRYLGESPAAIAPADGGYEANILTQAHTASPQVSHLVMSSPDAPERTLSVEEIESIAQAKLSLKLDKWGDAQPLRN